VAFETLACPWNSPANIRTLAKGAAANQSGLLMTTWLIWRKASRRSLGRRLRVVQDQAALAMKQMDGSLMRAAAATHLRKLVPAKGKFERAGWNPFEQPAEAD